MDAMPPKRTPWEPRLWAKVNKTDDHWLWTGHISTNGYGRFSKHHGEPSEAAHRLVYELVIGPIPEGMDLDHKCRVRPCVRPDHLEPVTRAENLARGDMTQWGWQRTKTECVNGHPFTKENTYVRPDRPNRRECLICRRAASRRHRSNAPSSVAS